MLGEFDWKLLREEFKNYASQMNARCNKVTSGQEPWERPSVQNTLFQCPTGGTNIHCTDRRAFIMTSSVWEKFCLRCRKWSWVSKTDQVSHKNSLMARIVANKTGAFWSKDLYQNGRRELKYPERGRNVLIMELPTDLILSTRLSSGLVI